MKFLRNVLLTFCLMFVAAAPAYAQFTILPSAGDYTVEGCIMMIDGYEVATDRSYWLGDAQMRGYLLGCAIKTGRISLDMIPYFITYIANFLLSLVGLICVLFIVIGGYQYIAGGLTEQKEKGKKTISHALLGMVVSILSWVIVNVIIAAVTS